MNKIGLIISLPLILATLIGCNEGETQTIKAVNSRPACELFDERVAQKLFQMGLGGIGMQYNSDGTRIESDESRIGRCEGNLNKFASQADLAYISQHFTPCMENALGAKDENAIVTRTTRCLKNFKQNVGTVTQMVFLKYTFTPLFEDGRKALNGILSDFFKNTGF